MVCPRQDLSRMSLAGAPLCVCPAIPRRLYKFCKISTAVKHLFCALLTFIASTTVALNACVCVHLVLFTFASGH